jgi:hypothetical protein
MAMAARKRPLKARAIVYEDDTKGSPEPKRQAPDCLAYVELISPISDPKRVLLRRSWKNSLPYNILISSHRDGVNTTSTF